MTRLSKRNDIPEKERDYQSYFLLHDNDFMGHYYFRLNVCVYVGMCTWTEEPGSYHLLKAGGWHCTKHLILPITIDSQTTLNKSEVHFFTAYLCFLSSQALLKNLIALNFLGEKIHLYCKNY